MRDQEVLSFLLGIMAGVLISLCVHYWTDVAIKMRDGRFIAARSYNHTWYEIPRCKQGQETC